MLEFVSLALFYPACPTTEGISGVVILFPCTAREIIEAFPLHPLSPSSCPTDQLLELTAAEGQEGCNNTAAREFTWESFHFLHNHHSRCGCPLYPGIKSPSQSPVQDNDAICDTPRGSCAKSLIHKQKEEAGRWYVGVIAHDLSQDRTGWKIYSSRSVLDCGFSGTQTVECRKVHLSLEENEECLFFCLYFI